MTDITNKIGISILAFLFLVFPILNCCLLKSAHASTTIEDSHHEVLGQAQKEDSHPHGSDNTDAPETEDCGFDELSAALPNQNFIYFNSLAAKISSIDVLLTSYDIASNLPFDSKSLSYLYSPPQNSSDSVPIYLQNSTLRI